MMKKIKQILMLIVTCLILIIIFQNLQYVETRILFFTIILPRSVLLFFMALIGFVLGIMTSFFLRRKKKPQPLPSEEKTGNQ
ncbi:DUF1049 domain-containing protein [bacterium]|nr:DUF1049 domain-containing protein [bacterium]RQV95528.1 MAG: DUF1049 domain-containing protein [bacterium]